MTIMEVLDKLHIHRILEKMGNVHQFEDPSKKRLPGPRSYDICSEK